MNFIFIAILLATAHETLSYYYNPEENEGLLEGDIQVYGRKTVLLRPSARWPDAIVPYQFAHNLTERERNRIKSAMNAIHEVSCIRFVPKIDEDEAYITFIKMDEGCWSPLGRLGTEQVLNLGNKCYWNLGTIMHELMHALGFVHEQNRMDRDKYVKILWDNIKPSHKLNFEKSKEELKPQNVEYDYNSIMHYSRFAFTKPKEPNQPIKPTLKVKKKLGKAKMGQRIGFSCKDVLKMNLHYYCKAYIGKPVKSSHILEGKCSGKAMRGPKTKKAKTKEKRRKSLKQSHEGE